MKQWVEPLSTRALTETSEESEEKADEKMEMDKAFGSERAEALRQRLSGAQ
jgi:hypothetical protein